MYATKLKDQILCEKIQLTATPCNTLQHPATPCNTLHHPATGLTAKEQEHIIALFDEDGNKHIDFEEWRAISEMTKKGVLHTCDVTYLHIYAYI